MVVESIILRFGYNFGIIIMVAVRFVLLETWKKLYW
jgi:hypothetical protein